jgi:hypothetical protein
MAANTVSTLNGLFKETYAGQVENLVPEDLVFMPDVPFKSGEKMPGNLFHQPVTLQLEHGFTYAAAGAGAYSLNAALAGVMKDATVQGAQISLRSSVDYESLAKASGSGKRAFVPTTRMVVENATMSFKRRLEMEHLHGRIDLGVVESISTDTITFTAASWAPGIWAGAEGANIAVLNTGLTAALSTSLPVTAVDLVARTITATGAGAASVVATNRVFWEGQVTAGAPATWASSVGLHSILTNTGTLFGINAASFSLWNSGSVSAGSANLDFSHIQTAVARIVEKGGGAGRLVCYISTETWTNLILDEAALRRYDGENSPKAVRGASSIVYWTQAGPVEIKPSIYMKQGFAYIVDLQTLARIGSAEFGFGVPGVNGDRSAVFHELEGTAAFDLKSYSNQALFTKAAGRSAIITDIVNG